MLFYFILFVFSFFFVFIFLYFFLYFDCILYTFDCILYIFYHVLRTYQIKRVIACNLIWSVLFFEKSKFWNKWYFHMACDFVVCSNNYNYLLATFKWRPRKNTFNLREQDKLKVLEKEKATTLQFFVHKVTRDH